MMRRYLKTGDLVKFTQVYVIPWVDGCIPPKYEDFERQGNYVTSMLGAYISCCLDCASTWNDREENPIDRYDFLLPWQHMGEAISVFTFRKDRRFFFKKVK